ncbi:MAG TPA: SAM-dependent chlorinase/fluorinase [Acidimicrobiales bacterium]|nr:SAM-dependent chlorinase/fluorinase [Acidimicrobiales bacterium]
MRPASPGPGDRAPVVTFLSDFGLTDEFVGVVHSVIRRALPGAEIVDLAHEVPPCSVRAGARVLARAAPYLAPEVVLAVVDPGVGSRRRRIALAAGDLVMVGPDNGLLVEAADVLGGVSAAVELDRRDLWPTTESTTFDGRDVFAPVAAALAAGAALDDVGTRVDPATLVRLPPPPVERRPDGLRVEVTWVDRFGNLELGCTWSEVESLAGELTAVAGGRSWPVRPVASFTGAGTAAAGGPLGLLRDSAGAPSLVLDGDSAAAATGLAVGGVVELRRRRPTGEIAPSRGQEETA